jgi:hypothetical protein
MATSVYYRQYTDAPDSARPAHYVHSQFQSCISQAASRTGTHLDRVITLALPLIPMVFPKMGTVISYTSTLVNGGIEIYNLSFDSQKKFFFSIYKIFKQVVELSSLFWADLKTGLFVHHSIDVAEKAASCYANPQLDKIFEIASSSLYLISLYPFDREISFKIALASMVGQGMLSLYYARRAEIDHRAGVQNKGLECIAHVISAIGRFSEAYFCYQHVQQMKQALQKQHLFIWVQSGDQQKQLLPQLASEIETLRKVYGEKALTVVMPEPEAQQQTGTLLSQELHCPTVTTPGLHEYVEIKKPKRPKGAEKTPENKAIYYEKKDIYRARERWHEARLRVLKAFQNYSYSPSIFPVFVTPPHLTAETSLPGNTPYEFRHGDSLSITVIGFDGQNFTAWEKLTV